MKPALDAIAAELSEFTLPGWQELPDIDLYMDQVLSLIERYLRTEKNADEKLITSSMINNYVKYKIIPPPKAKKYSRSHLACLLMLCLLKPLLSTSDIRTVFSSVGEDGVPEFYESFREMLHAEGCKAAAELQETSDNARNADAVLSAVLRARAEQIIAVRMLESLAPEEET